MKIKQITQRMRRLIEPTADAGGRLDVGIIWHDVIIKGGALSQWALVLDENLPLEEVIAEVFSENQLVELAEIILATKKLGWDLSINLLVEKLNLPRAESSVFLLEKLVNQYDVLIPWLKMNKFKGRDLDPLLSIQNPNMVCADLVQLSSMNFSHVEAVSLLEWVIELKLMGHDLNSVWNQMSSYEKNSHQVFKEIKKIRYPQEADKMSDQLDLVKALPWPRKIQARIVRQNDRMGFEIKFFTPTLRELESNISGLSNVARALAEKKIERF